MNFKGKKILFVAPKFFNYENEIKNEMIKLGMEVDYYDERIKNTSLIKGLIRLNFKKIIQKKIDNYYKNILDETNDKNYDYILFITPETISKNLLEKLKKNQKKAEFILYMWDSIKNKKNTRNLLELFDRIYTFDKEDINIDFRFRFRPLFFIEEYEKNKGKEKLLYDYCFIGTAHSDRYEFFKKIEKQLRNFKGTHYFYFPSKLFFLVKKVFDKRFKNVKFKEISFESLSKKEVIRMIKESKCIIDIQHPNQKGLTMRSIETIGSERKLITTNNEIENYDFFNPNNILIVDRKNPIISEIFIKKEYEEISEEIYNKYRLKNWVIELLSDI